MEQLVWKNFKLCEVSAPLITCSFLKSEWEISALAVVLLRQQISWFTVSIQSSQRRSLAAVAGALLYVQAWDVYLWIWGINKKCILTAVQLVVRTALQKEECSETSSSGCGRFSSRAGRAACLGQQRASPAHSAEPYGFAHRHLLSQRAPIGRCSNTGFYCFLVVKK